MTDMSVPLRRHQLIDTPQAPTPLTSFQNSITSSTTTGNEPLPFLGVHRSARMFCFGKRSKIPRRVGSSRNSSCGPSSECWQHPSTTQWHCYPRQARCPMRHSTSPAAWRRTGRDIRKRRNILSAELFVPGIAYSSKRYNYECPRSFPLAARLCPWRAETTENLDPDWE